MLIVSVFSQYYYYDCIFES